ncbi:DUF2218 domain-containing protein [Roseococcus sp. DSY-14]|uniref:DUF2218 domain-containing protein n=1 Tax=Roseococcus sp. DSY-14 TaxID=3369650 RepID=UPI00387B4C95
MMAASAAEVALDQPGRFLSQLCRHFAHRLPVTEDGARGSIAFAGGTCTLRAAPGALHLRLEAEDAATRARLEEVVASHLLRFAFRDPPEVRWVPGA